MANAELISEAVLALLEPRLKAVELGLENNFKAITAQIKQSSDNIEAKLETVDKRLNTLHADVEALTKTTGANYSAIKTLKSKVAEHQVSIDKHDERLQTLEAKLASAEDRNRRCNLRISSLKEGEENSNAVQYLHRILPLWFPSLATHKIEVMRAHRIYADEKEPEPGRTPRPRTLIFCCLRQTTRDAILRAARDNPLTVAGRELRFTPDYSAHTYARRLKFSDAQKTAREKGLVHFLLFPARLHVKVGSVTKEFLDHEEAELFLSKLDSGTEPSG